MSFNYHVLLYWCHWKRTVLYPFALYIFYNGKYICLYISYAWVRIFQIFQIKRFIMSLNKPFKFKRVGKVHLSLWNVFFSNVRKRVFFLISQQIPYKVNIKLYLNSPLLTLWHFRSYLALSVITKSNKYSMTSIFVVCLFVCCCSGLFRYW